MYLFVCLFICFFVFFVCLFVCLFVCFYVIVSSSPASRQSASNGESHERRALPPRPSYGHQTGDFSVSVVSLSDDYHYQVLSGNWGRPTSDWGRHASASASDASGRTRSLPDRSSSASTSNRSISTICPPDGRNSLERVCDAGQKPVCSCAVVLETSSDTKLWQITHTSHQCYDNSIMTSDLISQGTTWTTAADEGCAWQRMLYLCSYWQCFKSNTLFSTSYLFEYIKITVY